MFTGLIQALGTINAIDAHHIQLSWAMSHGSLAKGPRGEGPGGKGRGTQGKSRAAHSRLPFEDVAIGDSIAVDGICLTVTQIHTQGFTAAVSPETLRRTTLGKLLPRSIVNLEPSLRVGSKLGGHFVTGHIDGVGYFQQAVRTANAWEMSICVPEAIARYIVPKGSVAINGISLTVANCSASGDRFSVAVIPLTYEDTNLQFLQPQSPVNIEADVLGKYVEKFLSAGRDVPANDGTVTEELSNRYGSDRDAPQSITAAFLAEHGYG